MKKLFVFFALTIAIVACQSAGSQQKKDKTAQCSAGEVTTLTPDDLFGAPEKYVGQEITVKGLCIHTCKHSGKRMFLQGSDKDQLLLITASSNMAKFENSLEGSNVVVTGIFSHILQTKEHEHEANGKACETESKSKNYQVACQSFVKAD